MNSSQSVSENGLCLHQRLFVSSPPFHPDSAAAAIRQRRALGVFSDGTPPWISQPRGEAARSTSTEEWSDATDAVSDELYDRLSLVVTRVRFLGRHFATRDRTRQPLDPPHSR